MKVLTIKQPWATLIAEGIKKYEFRSWPTKYRGKILIHAGLSYDSLAMKKLFSKDFDYPSGALIAEAQIVDVIKVDEAFRQRLQRENAQVYENIITDHTWQGYAFKLANIKKIKPIEIKGKLGFWNYDYDYEIIPK